MTGNGEHVRVDVQPRNLACWSHLRGRKPGYQPGAARHIQNAPHLALRRRERPAQAPMVLRSIGPSNARAALPHRQ